MASDVRLTDGQFDFSWGVDSSRVPQIRSQYTPNGLQRNALAWLTNGTVRGGGILQRTGYQYLCTVHDKSAIYQGGWMFDTEPQGGNAPYLMLSIGGRMFQVRVDTDNSVHDVTGAFADPPNAPQAYFVQGEQFMVKQAGDGVTNPLFWDGNNLRRSNGITGSVVYPNINELPPATSMSYYMGRIWYARNRIITAGDIVDNQASGTAPYAFTDSILKVTENPLALAGDGFRLPSQAGNIRAIAYPITLDTTFGQGPLFIFTPKQIYALTVPVTRTDWIAATANNQPLLRVVMNSNGTVSERSVVAVNGDLFYQTLTPAIQSFFMALRYFQGWGNTPISNNLNRVLQFNDRSLMRTAPGMTFGNRLYQGILPIQTPVGVGFQGIAVMDLDPISTLQEQKPPAWDGMQEGLDVLQLFAGNFGGRERAFAVVHSRIDDSIQVWEITDALKFDVGATPQTSDNRVTMYMEMPSHDWSGYSRKEGGGPMEIKMLDGLDLSLDKVFGTVDIKLQFRTDSDPCLYNWGTQQICAARTCAENPMTPNCYPITVNREQYRIPITFGQPLDRMTCGVATGRPVGWGFRFQPVLTIKGWCRVTGYQIHALPKMLPPFPAKVC